MPRLSRFTFVILCLLLVTPPAAAQTLDFTPLETTIRQELETQGIPGAAIAVVRGGKVVFIKGFGIANVETGMPMTPDLLFRLGSTTKMFTAAALAQLADKGAVDLHKPVATYITALDPAVGRVTSHQLLSHTAGFFDEAPMFGRHDEDALTKNVLAWKADRFFTEPGKVYSYSNPGYWLAGAVIEAASGKLYADQLNDALFAPLGMSHTTLRPTVAMTYPLAQGHDVAAGKPVVVRPFANNAASWPAGSIFSSVEDLARFVVAFVNEGRIDGKQIVSPGVFKMISTAAAKVPGGDSEYGYGLSLRTQRGVRIVQHGGSRSGYGSSITMVPERQFGVVVLANRSGASLPRSAAKAMEIVLGLAPDRRDTTPTAAALTSQEMARYVGVYSQGQRSMEIVARDGKLFLKQGQRETELQPTGELRLGSYSFVAAPDGTIEYLHSGGRSWKKIRR